MLCMHVSVYVQTADEIVHSIGVCGCTFVYVACVCMYIILACSAHVRAVLYCRVSYRFTPSSTSFPSSNLKI